MVPSNITELRAVLCDTIAAVRAKEITPDAAEAVSNASGKIVASFRVELEYRRMRGEVPSLAFMDCPNDLALAQQGLGRSVDEAKEGSSRE